MHFKDIEDGKNKIYYSSCDKIAILKTYLNKNDNRIRYYNFYERLNHHNRMIKIMEEYKNRKNKTIKKINFLNSLNNSLASIEFE